MLVKPATANISPEGKRAAGPTIAALNGGPTALNGGPPALNGGPPAAGDLSGGHAAAGAEAAPTVYLNLARRAGVEQGCEVGST